MTTTSSTARPLPSIPKFPSLHTDAGERVTSRTWWAARAQIADIGLTAVGQEQRDDSLGRCLAPSADDSCSVTQSDKGEAAHFIQTDEEVKDMKREEYHDGYDEAKQNIKEPSPERREDESKKNLTI